jgi:hypothetical protein
MTQIMTDEQTSVVTEPDIRTSGDKSESAHIVISPNEDETHHAYVMRARLECFPVTALCGWVWVPKRMASDLPVCSECKDIWDSLPDDGKGWVRE